MEEELHGGAASWPAAAPWPGSVSLLCVSKNQRERELEWREPAGVCVSEQVRERGRVCTDGERKRMGWAGESWWHRIFSPADEFICVRIPECPCAGVCKYQRASDSVCRCNSVRIYASLCVCPSAWVSECV